MSSPQVHWITILPEQTGTRLDKLLARLDFMPSRARATELIGRGLVTRNDRALKASQKLNAGDRIRIEIPPAEPGELRPLDRPLEILFEDADVVVLNKPSGLVVHPAAGHAQDTLVNMLLHHVKELSVGFGASRPGIVHRLDRDTSGILVVAKNDLAHHGLAAQFKAKSAHRIYWALAHGTPRAKENTVRSLLARHPADRKRFASNAKTGKTAITHFRALRANRGVSWIECRLETGRTHQIRVHLSEAGLPILGDPLYGSKARDRQLNVEVPRLALHARELGFAHPRTGESMRFEIGWPEELETLARGLGLKDV